MHTAVRFPRSYMIGALLLLVASGPMPLPCQEPDRAASIYAETSKSVYLLVVKSEQGSVIGQGTGFLISDGKIVTNEHVIRGGSVFIDLGAATLPATVEKVDAFNDLAVISTAAELSSKPLTIAEELPAPGSAVHAIGNPAGLERSISSGVLSGLREFEGRQLLQITAPISPGSSGGPVFDNTGHVVGVTVGILNRGQNLNFAVPISLVQKLLKGEVEISNEVSVMIEKAVAIRRGSLNTAYSTDPDSEYQRTQRQIADVLRRALDYAGSDPTLLLAVAKSSYSWPCGESICQEIQIEAAERSFQAKPSAESSFVLGKALAQKATFDAQRSDLLTRAEKALRTAFELTSQPTAEMYFELGGILESRESYAQADQYSRRALELFLKQGDITWQGFSLRQLSRIAYSMGNPVQGQAWFDALVKLGKAEAWDWSIQGRHLAAIKRYAEAGQSYQRAAVLRGGWRDWCKAAEAFALSDDQEDSVLFCARKCVSEGVGKEYSDDDLAYAHRLIASVLNERAVYQEALSHARESTAITPSDPWSYSALARALLGLRRFQEAINASTQAIRLSDGKYPSMHFDLGAAYFETENWEFARQSFETAAKLDSSDSSAAYNVAICLVRIGFYRDAARWYEEVLRRNPNHPDRQEIRDRIQQLRR